MTMQSMAALIIKRAKDTKKIIDARELLDQGYNPLEIADYMYAITMAQVKKDIIPITINEVIEKTGAPPEHVLEAMKNYLMEAETA